MEQKLNIPHGQRQREFLDYLNSALLKRLSTYQGTSGLNYEGVYQTTIFGPFEVDGISIPLSWNINIDSEGTLQSISVEATDTKISEDKWENAIQKFISDVLAATLSNTRNNYFRRSFFFYIGQKLDGEYWLPGYRFAPVNPSDPDPYIINAERIVSIDQEVSAVDEMHSRALAEESSRRHASRLSLLLNKGLYRPESTMRWVYPIDDGEGATESVRCQLGFVNPCTDLIQMPEKGEKCSLGSYKGSLEAPYMVAGEMQSLPSEARKILRGIDEAKHVVTNAFDACARLYQVATVCGRFFPSVGLAYRVAAVEAVCKADETCESFSEFMRKYVTSSKDIETLLKYMYGDVRSAHFHGGKFPGGEFGSQSYFNAFMDHETVERDTINRSCYYLTREAIVNWICEVIPEIS